jgi:hypothetical protein
MILIFFVVGCFAANNRLSTFNHDYFTKKSELDLVISVNRPLNQGTCNLDIDKLGDISSVPLECTRDYLEKSLFYFNSNLKEMTNGAHSINRFYIYENSEFSANADVHFQFSSGTSNAALGGFLRSGSVEQFTGIDVGLSSEEKEVEYLKFNGVGDLADYKASVDLMKKRIVFSVKEVVSILAHEFGHYVYAIPDEYIIPGSWGTKGLIDNPSDYLMFPSIMQGELSHEKNWTQNFSSQISYYKADGLTPKGENVCYERLCVGDEDNTCLSKYITLCESSPSANGLKVSSWELINGKPRRNEKDTYYNGFVFPNLGDYEPKASDCFYDDSMNKDHCGVIFNDFMASDVRRFENDGELGFEILYDSEKPIWEELKTKKWLFFHLKMIMVLVMEYRSVYF